MTKRDLMKRAGSGIGLLRSALLASGSWASLARSRTTASRPRCELLRAVPADPHRQGRADQHFGLAAADGDRLQRWRFALAIPLGLLMGRSRATAAFFNPLLMLIYPVPKAALMPIIMLWLGVGDISKTLVIFLGVSLPVIYHSFEGAKAVEEKMLWSGAAMGMPARGAPASDRAARGAARNPDRLPHRHCAGADHDGDERDDRAAIRVPATSCSTRSTWASTTSVFAMIIIIGAMGILPRRCVSFVCADGWCAGPSRSFDLALELLMTARVGLN